MTRSATNIRDQVAALPTISTNGSLRKATLDTLRDEAVARRVAVTDKADKVVTLVESVDTEANKTSSNEGRYTAANSASDRTLPKETVAVNTLPNHYSTKCLILKNDTLDLGDLDAPVTVTPLLDNIPVNALTIYDELIFEGAD